MERIKNIALYSLILLLPTQLGRHFFPDYTFISGVRIDYLSPVIYFTDILVFLVLVSNLEIIKNVFRSRSVKFLLIVILAHVFLSISWQVALYKWVKTISFVLLFHVYKNSELNLKLVLKLVLTGAAVQLILCALQLSKSHAIEGLWYWLGERYYRMGQPDIAVASLGIKQFARPYGTFSHPNSLGGFYLLVYVFTLLNPAFRRFGIIKNLLLLASSMLVFISFSKTAIITFAFVNTIYLISIKKRLDCALCLISRMTTVIVIAGIVLMANGDPSSAEKRINLVDNAVSIIVNYPLTGVGLGNYLIAQAEFPNKYPYFFLQPVHNVLLLFIAETGLILGGYFLFTIYKILKPYLRQGLIFNLILAVLITGMLDHYWLTLQQNILIVPVIFGLALNFKAGPHSLQQRHL